MVFETIATTASLIGTAISSAKNARDLAKETDDIKLKETVSEVYDNLLDLKARILSLDDDNRKLKAELAQKAAYIGPVPPSGYFYAESDREAMQHPVCPRCFQSSPQQIAYMTEPIPLQGGGRRRRCLLCNGAVDEVRGSSQSPRRTNLPHWSGS